MLLKKLRSHKGESLVESLVSILIAAVTIAALTTAIVTSSNVTAKGRKIMNDYYSANDTVILQSAGGVDGTVTVVERGGSAVKLSSADTSSDIEVSFFTNDSLRDIKVISYKVK